MTEGGEPRLRMTERGESAPQNDSSLVILSEAKNLFSRLKDMARKILRSEAPQNDRERGRAAPQNDSSIVILSEAKNLSSWLRGMVQKILRSEAPQNDRERGESAPQNDSLPPLSFCAPTPCPSALPPLVLLRFHPLSFCTYTPHCHSEPPLPLVILSEAKNLSSWLKDMARKILRSEAPQNDRGGRAAPQNDRERGERASE